MEYQSTSSTSCDSRLNKPNVTEFSIKEKEALKTLSEELNQIPKGILQYYKLLKIEQWLCDQREVRAWSIIRCPYLNKEQHAEVKDWLLFGEKKSNKTNRSHQTLVNRSSVVTRSAAKKVKKHDHLAIEDTNKSMKAAVTNKRVTKK
ncbi:uncharacterized protein [Halyomorpha halys]|uniref:uncharacterized protein n=1 Tax=Halyomorpha halys TaxID=286706 RepID=UPI0034D20E82